MTSGMDMLFAQVMPMLRKMIPDVVWEQVMASFQRMTTKVESVDDRLARIEQQLSAIHSRLFEKVIDDDYIAPARPVEPGKLEITDGRGVSGSTANGAEPTGLVQRQS